MSCPQVPLRAPFITVTPQLLTKGMCRINMQGMGLQVHQNRGQINLEEGVIKLEKAFLTKANLEALNGIVFQCEETGSVL